MTSQTGDNLHASSVSFDGSGILILGASGTGKSSLALELMSRGAILISDDQTIVELRDGQLLATAPAAITGQIEVRNIGILRADYAGPTIIRLVVDLDCKSTLRLPDRHCVSILDVEIGGIHAAGLNQPAAAIIQYLKGGRVA